MRLVEKAWIWYYGRQYFFITIRFEKVSSRIVIYNNNGEACATKNGRVKLIHVYFLLKLIVSLKNNLKRKCISLLEAKNIVYFKHSVPINYF